MLLRNLQVGLFLFLCVNSSAQDGGFTEQKKQINWKSKYYAVSEVTVSGDVQIVRVRLSRLHSERFQFEEPLRKRSDYKQGRVGEIVKWDIEVKKNDSLSFYKPFKTDPKDLRRLTLPVTKAVVIDDQKIFWKLIELHFVYSREQLVEKGDLILFSVENKSHNDSLLFYRLEDYRIELTDLSEAPSFENISKDFTTPAKEMEAAKVLLDDLKNGAAYYKDKIKTPFIKTGVYAGKAIPEIFDAATEKDIINAIHFIISYPRMYMGRTLRFADLYLDWIENGQPKGKISFLKIEQEYDKWVTMIPIFIDLKKGTVNDIPLQQAVHNWKNLFPWYDGDEKEYPGIKEPPYFKYSLLGNNLTYFVNEKALKLWVGEHVHYAIPDLKEVTPKEILQKFGKPFRVMGKPNIPDSYFYSRPYGTLEFRFHSFYGEAHWIYLYPVKPELVKQAESH